MEPTTTTLTPPARDEAPTPDVWWGAEGIDSLIWADPRPYDWPALGASTSASKSSEQA